MLPFESTRPAEMSEKALLSNDHEATTPPKPSEPRHIAWVGSTARSLASVTPVAGQPVEGVPAAVRRCTMILNGGAVVPSDHPKNAPPEPSATTQDSSECPKTLPLAGQPGAMAPVARMCCATAQPKLLAM